MKLLDDYSRKDGWMKGSNYNEDAGKEGNEKNEKHAHWYRGKVGKRRKESEKERDGESQEDKKKGPDMYAAIEREGESESEIDRP